jgi:hypothetical protein
MLKYLKYVQNNDGSFGTGTVYDKITKTAWAVLGLQKRDSGSEYLKDGKKWIYYNEPISGWGSIEKDTLAYLAIKEQIKPYVEINVRNYLTTYSEFTIRNPTIYTLKNIKVELSKELYPYFSYKQNIGDLEGDKSLTFNITLKDKIYSTITGSMKVTGLDGKNREIILAQFPINIEKSSLFTVIGKNYPINDENPTLELELAQSTMPYTLDCTYTNPFSQLTEKVTITQQSKTLPILALPIKEGEISFTMSCKKDTSTVLIPIKIPVSISKTTFTTNTSIVEIPITITGDIAIPITNTNTEKNTISMSIEGSLAQAITPAEASKILASGETREVYLQITDKTLLQALVNISDSYLVLKSDSGFTKKIQLIPITETSSSGSGLLMYGIIGFVALLLILIVVRKYRLQHQENEEHSENQEEMLFDDMHFK